MIPFIAVEDLIQFSRSTHGPFGFVAKFPNRALVFAQFESDGPNWGAILTVCRIPLQ